MVSLEAPRLWGLEGKDPEGLGPEPTQGSGWQPPIDACDLTFPRVAQLARHAALLPRLICQWQLLSVTLLSGCLAALGLDESWTLGSAPEKQARSVLRCKTSPGQLRGSTCVLDLQHWFTTTT